MKNAVRLPAVIFAAFSAGYWGGVQGFWMMLSMAYAQAYSTKAPLVVDLTVMTIPTVIYAVACVLFSHWLARRVARRLSQSEGQ